MSNYLDGTKEQFQAFMALPFDKPLRMLNLLKFKDTVAENGRTGYEQYEVYMKAATPFLQQAKAKIIYSGIPRFTFIGPAGALEWDKVIIVEYATKEAFINMVMRPDYPTALRRMALADSRLILCE